MKNIILLLEVVLLISCNVDSDKSVYKLWKDGQQYRVEEKLKESLTNFKTIIASYPKHDLSANAQYQIADIYLNDTKDFEYAVNEFKIVIEKYPDYEEAKKSLFMIGYIYNNYLDSYSDAIIYYKLFKNKYPDDELIPSVEFELDGLEELQSKIDSLNYLINQKPSI